MKSINLNYLTLVFSILTTFTLAQTYTCTIDTQIVNGSDFSYEIYMQRTDATEIYLGQSEFSLEFNNFNFTSPNVTYILGPAMTWYTVDVAIPTGYSNVVKFSVGELFFQSNQANFDARVCKPSTTAPGTLIATITISGITNFAGTAGLHWRTIAPHDSKVNSYAPTSPWNLTNITSLGTYTDPPDWPLPVELSSFTVKASGDKVELKWETKTEVSNYGFEIERSSAVSNENKIWQKIGFVEGNGNSNSPKQYSFKDNNPWGGSKFIYRLKQIDTDGAFEYSDEVEVELLPSKYELFQNYPNPFNPITSIKFSLPEDAQVSIKIYDMLGALVDELVNAEYKAGYHKVDFNAGQFASGIYIYRLESKNFISIKKMVLIK
jgi:hypothetical protein